jgi:FtsH-binding integral membrane protein
MKSIRFALSLGAAILLMAGYLASQVAYLQGAPSAYAARVDQPPVRVLCALLLVVALVLSFFPDREETS